MSLTKVVVVGGGGHVGLPLALVLAKSGFLAVALDISKSVVDKINSGTMPFAEEGAQHLLTKMLSKRSFYASTDHKEISTAEIVIVVIGTPVDEHLNPDPNSVVHAMSACIPYMNSKQLAQTNLCRRMDHPGVAFSP